MLVSLKYSPSNDLQIFLWLNLMTSHSVQEIKHKMKEDGAISTLSLGRSEKNKHYLSKMSLNVLIGPGF